jgi:hypothetical protein
LSNIYHELAKYLDSLPAGFPPAEDGSEIKILKHLFREKEAALALNLDLLGENASVIARKAGIAPGTAADMLEEMVKKGLISASYPEGKPPQYAISQFVIGFYEGQVDRLNPDMVDLFETYAPTYFEDDICANLF